MNSKTKTFETERLILRKFKKSDAKDIFNNYSSKANVTKYLTWKPHKTLDDAKNYLLNFALASYDDPDTYRWAIVLKETNEVVGCIDVVRMIKERRKVELGWVLDDMLWGRGLMPEAAKVVLEYLIKEGFARIEGHHHIENEKSGRVMQKIGMQFEGILKKYSLDNDGKLVDMKMYAYVAEENC